MNKRKKLEKTLEGVSRMLYTDIYTDDLGLCWCFRGGFHRDFDKPALMWNNGDKGWWKFGKAHREGNKPAKILDDGAKFWYIDGKFIK